MTARWPAWLRSHRLALRVWAGHVRQRLQGPRRTVVKGCIEEVSAGQVKGWAFDARTPETAPRIRVLLGDAVIAEDVAGTDRPDVAKVMGLTSAVCGFRIPVSLDADALSRVTVQASSGGKWAEIARIRPR